MTKREQRYFNLAKATALCSPHKEFYVGCCVVLGHQILAVAHNQVKSHPLQKELNKFRYAPCDSSKDYLHAELSALLKLKGMDLRGAVIYVYREDRNGLIANCRPCPACMTKIREVGIKIIYYTTRDGFCREELKN